LSEYQVDNFTVEKLQCRYWDGAMSIFPAVENTAMFVTTRVGIAHQALTNSANASIPCTYELLTPDCVYKTANYTNMFVAVAENFTIMIDHSFLAPAVDVHGEARTLSGTLIGRDGQPIQPQNPAVERIGQAGFNDIIMVDTFMKAAGLQNLNDESGYISLKPGDKTRESYRFAGTVLMVYITYSNTYSFDLSAIDYTYSATFLNSTEFKVTENVPTLQDSTTRTLYDRHGVRLLFKQVGELGRFDFQVLLLSFVGGIGLITVSTVLVDLLALYVLPQKKVYRDLKYVETEEIENEHPNEKTALIIETTTIKDSHHSATSINGH